jgi:hypothetical protein
VLETRLLVSQAVAVVAEQRGDEGFWGPADPRTDIRYERKGGGCGRGGYCR